MTQTSLRKRGNGDLLRSTSSLLSDFFSDPFFSTDFPLTEATKRMPNVNIRETDNDFVVEVAAPGMKKDDFHVNVENGKLNIWAEKEESSEEENKNFTRKEYSYNSFSRSFVLPETVKSEEVKAHYENGILELSLPKTEDARKKRIAKEIKIF